MSIKNATQMPQVYYGLHMVEGVAEYAEPSGRAYRILICENAIKSMDPTFSGKPVYVQHVDDVKLEDLHNADGYVVESFFNRADGKHWTKFLVVSDKGHEAIRNGWKLSNAYVPKEFASGGKWHNVDYLKEVISGEYEHLAIVPNPRYAESVILTPEQFKSYNVSKELELSKLANSKEEKSMLNFFKKTKIENAAAADLESASVTLSTGKEMTIKQLINDAEEAAKAPDHVVVDMHAKIKVGEEEMTVEELVAKYLAASRSKESDGSVDGEKQNTETDAEKKKREEEEAAAKKKNEEDRSKADAAAAAAEAEKKKTNAGHFDALKGAPDSAKAKPEPVLDLGEDKSARGRARYGSGS